MSESYMNFASISDGEYQLFMNTVNDDCWLMKDGVLIKKSSMYSDDPIIRPLVREFFARMKKKVDLYYR